MAKSSDDLRMRADARRTIISMIADGLEARHSVNELRDWSERTFEPPPDPESEASDSECRADETRPPGSDNVLFDLLRLGFHTTRELLEIQTRANRQLTQLLRRTTPRARELRHDGRHVKLGPSGKGSFRLDNDSPDPLRVLVPEQVRMQPADGAKARIFAVEGTSKTITSRGHERFDIVVAGLPDAGVWMGNLELATTTGDSIALPLMFVPPVSGSGAGEST